MKIINKAYSLALIAPLAAAAFFSGIARVCAQETQLPPRPLNEEYTTTTNETIPANWWWTLEIGSAGVWNIVGDMAQVNWEYESSHNNILTGAGTINLGSDTQSGALYIMGSNPPNPDSHWNMIVNFNGAINVNKMGSLSFGGSYISRWGRLEFIDTLNINGGMVSVMSETENHSYFCVKNLSIRDGGTFDSVLDLQTDKGGVWDLHSQGVSSRKLRVTSGDFTLNLRSENVLNNLPNISVDENTGTNIKLNVSADNTIGTFELNDKAVIGIEVADGAVLKIEKLAAKNSAQKRTGVEFIFYDYSADAVLFSDSDLWVEDSKLYIPSVDTYVTLTAYDGEGNLLEGEWFYDWNGESGRLVLNAVPEPEVAAAVLGALSLAFAARRRRD